MLYIRTVSSLLWLSIVRRKSPNFKSFCSRTAARFSTMAYSVQESGSLHTQDYKIYLRGENGPVSSFHDIPLFANKEKNIFNMIVEIPRWTNAKLEINKKEKLNPIMQDIKKGKVRFVNNVFPYTGYIWNYGALPQTWEDPNEVDDSTKCKGDNDPIDVCEIGHKVAQRGEIKQVKILGTFALIDEGETDWKILVIDVKDPLADKINDISGIRQHMPGLLEATHEWFKLYKIPAGKPENQFAFNGEAKDKEFAIKTVLSTHEHWKKLIKTKPTVADDISWDAINPMCLYNDGIEEMEHFLLLCPSFDIQRRDLAAVLALVRPFGVSHPSNEILTQPLIDNVSVEDSPFKISPDAANQILAKAAARGKPAEIPPEVDTWHFVPQSSAVTNAGKN